MKILIYGMNYAPELTGIGKYSAEMAESLVALGHDVRVVCAPPYYPDWRVAQGFSGWRYSRRAQAGVDVWRGPVWVPKTPGGAKRMVHLVSFAISSFPVVLRQVLWRPDAVVAVAPSLMNAPVAWFSARLARASAWLHIQDFEVDAAFGLGMLKGARLKRVALSIERLLMQRFDVVSTISRKMIERAASKGVPPKKLFAFPNWVDIDKIFPLEKPSEMRLELDIPTSATVVLYSGNMGAKQGLEVLAAAAVSLANREDLVFVFCGNGPTKKVLMKQCEGLANCRFVSLQPIERLNTLLNLADIHVLPQRADAADLVMPSKLTGMLASGRAIVAMARAGTELHDVVVPRGVVVPPEQLEPLANALIALASDSARRATLGEKARAYAVSALSRDAVMGDFDARLRALHPENRRQMEMEGGDQQQAQKPTVAAFHADRSDR
ncbi:MULTISPECIES: glycosyltransferase WbuB [Paraburkholderia]|uniref:Glycosyltransferase WbuB n=1 Tax=Paraburkholderia madseniana TaxID=2599607 RepID=A0AAP5BGQ3_9BURK|nr:MULTISPECIES: glycosyltransferase WbuB [Paraburkholderia]MCX4149424.1 glycosyltransferase WbuB [Paraburkholderia madseniana]MDN7152359.1 glycosyltransferase WbuB [Paraburkholderia sp. WS6]MDQ6411241.1 glycosyltransferase WbuB [Paraburkholderia madseniana]